MLQVTTIKRKRKKTFSFHACIVFLISFNYLFFFFFFCLHPQHMEIPRPGMDGTHTIAVIRATAGTMLDPEPTEPQEHSSTVFLCVIFFSFFWGERGAVPVTCRSSFPGQNLNNSSDNTGSLTVRPPGNSFLCFLVLTEHP